jgi:predicted transcriptional regulator YdeE
MRRPLAAAWSIIEKLGSLTVVGLARKQSLSKTEGIPGQWQTFMEMYDQISNKVEPIPLSVTTDMDADGNFTYLTGVRVTSAESIPKGLVSQTVPAQIYAVFTWRSCFRNRQGLRRDLGPMGARERQGCLRRTMA